VRNTLSGASAILVADLPFTVFFLGLIFILVPPVAPVMVIMLPIFMFITWRSASETASAGAEERQSSQTPAGAASSGTKHLPRTGKPASLNPETVEKPSAAKTTRGSKSCKRGAASWSTT